MNTFYAKIIATNQTTYDTNTLSVLTETMAKNEVNMQRPTTLRIAEDIFLTEGDVYYFETEPTIHNEKEQQKVLHYRHVNDCELKLSEKERLMRTFYDFAPVDIEVVKTSVEAYLKQLKNPVISKITQTLYDKYSDSFYLYPAATKFHHAYIGGLAHHTETMLRVSEGLLKIYPFLNKDLLISGIILHDICKTIELSNYKEPEYTKEGRLIGHITMGVKAITKVAIENDLYDTEERLLLEHMILSHHYYGNFGSPKKPNIPEALVLHFIDNIDSKLAVLGETLKTIEPGTFTSPIPVLDREKFYKAKLKK